MISPLDEANQSPPGSHLQAKPVPSNRRFIAILACMAIAFIAVIVYRNRIRSEWWATQLASSARPEDRSYYTSCLMAAGDDALPAIRRLARDERPEIRSMALMLITVRPIETIVATIPPFLHDRDRDIRESAGMTLAFAGGREAIALLCDTAASPNEGVACSALAALGRTSDPAALAALCDALARRPQPLVRAQAAESLADAIAPVAERRPKISTDTCDPIAALVHALADTGTFNGALAAERQIERVVAHVVAKYTQPVTNPVEDSARRSVASVAAAGLSRLTGTDVAAGAVPDEPAAVAQFRSLIEARN